MPADRGATQRKAEALRQQGRVAEAIAEYVRLLEGDPRDWSAVNALGDLYVTAGDRGRATACFTRLADHLHAEGFIPRAVAAYRKVLKVDASHDHALLRLADLAVRQGLTGDAKEHLERLLDVRRRAQDEIGVADCLVRLAALGAPQAPSSPPPAARTSAVKQQEPDAQADAAFEAALAEVQARTHSELSAGPGGEPSASEPREVDSLAEALAAIRELVEQELAAEGQSRVAVLYELAVALEEAGESAGALEVLSEIDAATPGYRDVGERIDRSRAALGDRPPR